MSPSASDIPPFMSTSVSDTSQSMTPSLSDISPHMNSSVSDIFRSMNSPVSNISPFMSSSVSDTSQSMKPSASDISPHMNSPVSDISPFVSTSVSNMSQFMSSSVSDIPPFMSTSVLDTSQSMKPSASDISPHMNSPVSDISPFMSTSVSDMSQFMSSSDMSQFMSSSVSDIPPFMSTSVSDTSQSMKPSASDISPHMNSPVSDISPFMSTSVSDISPYISSSVLDIYPSSQNDEKNSSFMETSAEAISTAYNTVLEMNQSSFLMETPLNNLDMSNINGTTPSGTATDNLIVTKILTSMVIVGWLTESSLTLENGHAPSMSQSPSSTIVSGHETTLVKSEPFQNSPEIEEDYFTLVLASQLLGSSVVQISGNFYPCTSIETTVSSNLMPSVAVSYQNPIHDSSTTSSSQPELDTENRSQVFSSHTVVFDLETDHYLHPSQTRMESSWHLQPRMETTQILTLSPVDTLGINAVHLAPPSSSKLALLKESSPTNLTPTSTTTANVNEQLEKGPGYKHINDNSNTEGETTGFESENTTNQNTSKESLTTMEMTVSTSTLNFSEGTDKGPNYRHINDSNNTEGEITGSKLENKASNLETKSTGDTEIEFNTTGNNSRQDAPYVLKQNREEPLLSLTSVHPTPATLMVPSTGAEITGNKSENKTSKSTSNSDTTLADSAEIKFNTTGNNSRQDVPCVERQHNKDPLPCLGSVQPTPTTQVVSATTIHVLLDSTRPPEKTPQYIVHKTNKSQSKVHNQTNTMYRYKCKQIENMTLALKANDRTSGDPAITKIEPMSARQKRVLIITLVASFMLAILCFASMCCVLGGRREISIPATFGRVRYALSGRSANWSVEGVPMNGIPGRVQLNTNKEYDTKISTV